MKDVQKWFTEEDFLNLMKNKKDKRICFTETIIYKDNEQMKIFAKEFWGEFTEKPFGNDGVSIERIIKFNGYTIAEKRDKGETSHKKEDYVWIQFAKWFSLR